MANNQELLAMAVQEMNLEKGFEHYAESIFEAYQNGELLTFAEWKKRGYSVKKGEKSVFQCKLWKKLSKKEVEEFDKKFPQLKKLEFPEQWK